MAHFFNYDRYLLDHELYQAKTSYIEELENNKIKEEIEEIKLQLIKASKKKDWKTHIDLEIDLKKLECKLRGEKYR
jgi:hypothetical protein